MPVGVVGPEEPGYPVPPGVCLHQSDLLRVRERQGAHQHGQGAFRAPHQHDRCVRYWLKIWVLCDRNLLFKNVGLLRIFGHVEVELFFLIWCRLIQVLLGNEPASRRSFWLSSSLRWKGRRGRRRLIRESARPDPLRRHRPAYPK